MPVQRCIAYFCLFAALPLLLPASSLIRSRLASCASFDSIRSFKSLNNLVGWLVFAIAFATYLLTLEPTASFWGCGEFEFIACSFKLLVYRAAELSGDKARSEKALGLMNQYYPR